MHTNETREQCYDLRQTSEQGVCRSSAQTHTGLARFYQTQIETNTGVQDFNKFICRSICDSVCWSCSLKIHSATRRQMSIPIVARMTPLTEQKSLNLHDETTAWYQVQHAFFRAVVRKLQYITGVRPDLMFFTKCLSYKLPSPTLAD